MRAWSGGMGWQIVAGTLPPGTLWIAESMPGHTERADITIMLNGRSGFWFSFNIPYFSSIASAGGYNTVGMFSSPDAFMQSLCLLLPCQQIIAHCVAKHSMYQLSQCTFEQARFS